MGRRLEGKSAVVTAAGQGMGAAAVLALAREGARVHATDIHIGKLSPFRDDENISVHALNVTKAEDIVSFSQRVGAPDILFNCAGFVHHGTILECGDDEFNFSVDLNFRSMYRMIRAFLPGMIEGGGGSIINMASVASSMIAAPNRFVYGATKAAVIGLTKSVAIDYVAKGIRSNAICPGTVDSPSLHDRMREQGNYDEARAAFIARQPMGRLGTAEEIAELIVYLASDESRFMTGNAIAIDGGWTNA